MTKSSYLFPLQDEVRRRISIIELLQSVSHAFNAMRALKTHALRNVLWPRQQQLRRSRRDRESDCCLLRGVRRQHSIECGRTTTWRPPSAPATAATSSSRGTCRPPSTRMGTTIRVFHSIIASVTLV